MATDIEIKEKADYLIELHKPLRLGDVTSYALVFCDNVLKNPDLSNEKRDLYTGVVQLLEAKQTNPQQ